MLCFVIVYTVYEVETIVGSDRIISCFFFMLYLRKYGVVLSGSALGKLHMVDALWMINFQV